MYPEAFNADVKPTTVTKHMLFFVYRSKNNVIFPITVTKHTVSYLSGYSCHVHMIMCGVYVLSVWV
jgi:hypothetical protein